MGRSSYVIVDPGQHGDNPLIIRDVGPWDQFLSVTNNAQQVVEELRVSGKLRVNQRLFYYDSEGQLDEILHKNGRFTGFQPVAPLRKSKLENIT